MALVRPEAMRLVPTAGTGIHVLAVSFLGSLCRVQVALPSGEIVFAQMSAADSTELGVGTEVQVTVRPAPVFAVETPTA